MKERLSEYQKETLPPFLSDLSGVGCGVSTIESTMYVAVKD